MSNTTDTNQASELFELCKQVYEATGLADTIDYFYLKNNGDYNVDRASHTQVDHNWWKLGSEVPARCFPLYTSDYLLEKLPEDVKIDKDSSTTYTASKFFFGKNSHTDDIEMGASNPLKALLKLCLVLKEAGEI